MYRIHYLLIFCHCSDQILQEVMCCTLYVHVWRVGVWQRAVPLSLFPAPYTSLEIHSNQALDNLKI